MFTLEKLKSENFDSSHYLTDYEIVANSFNSWESISVMFPSFLFFPCFFGVFCFVSIVLFPSCVPVLPVCFPSKPALHHFLKSPQFSTAFQLLPCLFSHLSTLKYSASLHQHLIPPVVQFVFKSFSSVFVVTCCVFRSLLFCSVPFACSCCMFWMKLYPLICWPAVFCIWVHTLWFQRANQLINKSLQLQALNTHTRMFWPSVHTHRPHFPGLCSPYI